MNSAEQINQEHVMALLRDQEGFNNQELFEFVHGYCTDTLNARAAAFQQHMTTPESFYTNFDSVHDPVLLAREEMELFQNSSLQKLGCIGFWKKASAVFFTAAAAISAAAAAIASNAKTPVVAAAASAATILFGALGKWTRSVLQNKESIVKKHGDTIGAMIEGTDAIINDLVEIKRLAQRWLEENESLSIFFDDDGAMEVAVWDEKQAALNGIFQEYRGKGEDYFNRISWARGKVLESIINNTRIDAATG